MYYLFMYYEFLSVYYFTTYYFSRYQCDIKFLYIIKKKFSR
jgi:hypothetical protein